MSLISHEWTDFGKGRKAAHNKSLFYKGCILYSIESLLLFLTILVHN